MNDLQIKYDIIKQFKKLDAKEEKLFYYSFGKMEHKVRVIEKSKRESELIDHIENVSDGLTVNISYNEIKELENVKRVDRYTFEKVRDRLFGNATITVFDEEESIFKVYYVYNHIYFYNKERRIEVLFNREIVKVFENVIDGKKSPFVNIKVNDFKKIKGTRELKLYLYCLGIWRKETNSGVININIDKLRNIIGKTCNEDDTRFVYKYISIPINNLNNTKGLTKKISFNRKGEIITISVSGNKEGK